MNQQELRKAIKRAIPSARYFSFGPFDVAFYIKDLNCVVSLSYKEIRL